MTISISNRNAVIMLGSLLAAFLGAALMNSMNSLGILRGLPFAFDAVFNLIVIVAVGLLPGYLIVSLLGMDGFSLGERFLFSIGISLTIDSFVGICLSEMHYILPEFYPLRNSSMLFISFLLVDLVLFLVYILRNNNSNTEEIALNNHTAVAIIITIFIIALSILGAFVVNAYSSPDLIIGFLLFVIFFVLFQGFVQFNEEMNALIVWGLSLAVIFHRDLITSYIIGTDVQMTHYLASFIAAVGYWGPNMGYSAPAVNVVLVPAIYKGMIGISIYNIDKYLYALLFSLVPVGMYYAFRKDGAQRAFWGAIVFIFYFEFFSWTPGKQEIAELFIILVVLVVKGFSINRKNRFASMALILIFLTSIAMTHEGISWILAFVFLPVMLASRIFNTEYSFFRRTYIFYLVVVLAWFMNLANGSVFDSVILTIRQAIDSVFGLFVTVQDRTAVSTVAYLPHSVLWKINALLYYILTALLVIGIGALLRNILFGRWRSPDESPYLAIFFFAFLMTGFVITGNFGTDRAYQISLLVLSPYVVDGYNILITIAGRLFNIIRGAGKTLSISAFRYTGLSLFLGVYFLFNTGLVYYLLGQPVASAISLTPNANTVAYNTAELTGALWLKNAGSSGRIIYSDLYTETMLYSVFPGSAFADLSTADESVSYVFIRQRAVVKNIIGIDYGYLRVKQVRKVASVKGKIYSNGYSTIFD